MTENGRFWGWTLKGQKRSKSNSDDVLIGENRD